MDIFRKKKVNNPLIIRAHITEIEELRDTLLAHAKMGHADAREMVVKLHKVAMEKRDRLRGISGNII
jgi:hypothetical protein